MPKPQIRLVRNEAEIRKMKDGLGYGLLNLGMDIMEGYQSSFGQAGGPLPRPASSPGSPPNAQTGNLRRSAHVVVYVLGREIASVGQGPGGYDINAEMGVVVGTNTGYGLFLEVGTSRMAARPALVPAAIRSQGRAAALIEDGARAHYRGTP